MTNSKTLEPLNSLSNSNKNKVKVVVGMSGGVDSSVAAYLLKQQGYNVTGVFMKNWEEDDTDDYCAAAEDMADAKSVAKQLDIPFKSINFSAEYWDRVFEYFLQEYRLGRTPNPDIMCNKEIKFKAFLDYAKILGADYIATGHYARVKHQTDKRHKQDSSQMLRGIDQNKDQTYFLYTLQQAQLNKTLFPIGELEKSEVRKIAKEQGFTTAEKKDSTGICFIGERKFNDFLKKYIPGQPGDIETVEGEVIGQHSGLMFHTLGQRKGIGIGGLVDASEDPWYVVDKDIDRNVLIVGQGHDHPRMQSIGLIASQLDWIQPKMIEDSFRCTAKTRYRQTDVSCLVERNDDASEVKQQTSYQVTFDEKQRAVTPGQSIVFYQGDYCIGGGIIDKIFSSKT